MNLNLNTKELDSSALEKYQTTRMKRNQPLSFLYNNSIIMSNADVDVDSIVILAMMLNVAYQCIPTKKKEKKKNLIY